MVNVLVGEVGVSFGLGDLVVEVLSCWMFGSGSILMLVPSFILP